jgi:hypothetical protein
MEVAVKRTMNIVRACLCVLAAAACSSSPSNEPDGGFDPDAGLPDLDPDAAMPELDAAPEPVVIDKTADRAYHPDGSGDFTEYVEEREECEERGWSQRLLDTQVGNTIVKRKLLFKAPADDAPWKGAILILHGGGSNYTAWCAGTANGSNYYGSQAVGAGFGVFLLDSTDIVSDREGAMCGKVWDDKVIDRDNYDLPYIESVITAVVPEFRPDGSDEGIFVSGFSSGGYMTIRASSHFNHLVTAFAPVGSGSPYGWYRDCSQESGRDLVAGIGLDIDTDKQIVEVGACGPIFYDPEATYPNEVKWDDGGADSKPPFLKLHHFYDAIADVSCHTRARHQLLANGYPGEQFVLAPEGATRHYFHHTFNGAYTPEILNFFEAQ